ncbi:LPP20 family lipoprotein [Sulfurimonas sp.]|uniref:LPP20 family lipoprotein n=1 Tax=Sulfurimonas sp. TaxID=2022749 RepID=UPI00356AA39F
MIKSITSMALAGLVAATITGCGGAAPAPEEETVDDRCRTKGGQLAPEWVCTQFIEGAEYAAVGIGNSKMESMRRKKAEANGRQNLAHQIETKVKSKVEDFMRSTGNGDSETIDAVTTSVTKQTAKVTLTGSRIVKQWSAKDGNLYVLVAVSPESEKAINKQAQETVKTSFKNDEALWQQFQAKNALDELEKEFPAE